MSESIYAPPEADVTAPTGDQPRYYIVAPHKFILLSILTLTLYFVYWFYKNWQLIKEDDNASIWPPVRAFFYIFFTHSLFTDVQESFKKQERTWDWQPGLLATLFVILTIVGNIIDRFVSYETYPILSTVLPLTSTIIVTFLLLPAQKAINAVCGDDTGSSNSKLTAANWAWMVVGGIFWLLILIGTYAMVMDPSLR
ncbi:MAG: hypothetical protein OEY37_03165 [Gammaproteobacteria bacterium]|nr:hypothetical protein [Gammaproteobacteria bacterium]